MLAIRLTRTGRKGHAQYRLIVQEARLTPTSGRIVAPLGSYNPHTKVAVIDQDKASFYLEHGARPSDRVARLLKKEGVKLPKWVQLAAGKKQATRNPEKLRRNRPTAEPAPPETPAEETPAEVEPETPEPQNTPEETPEETKAAEPEAATVTEAAAEKPEAATAEEKA